MLRPIFRVDDLLARAAEARPHHVAVVDGDRRVTYSELEARVDALTRALLEDGLARGERVAIWLERCVEAVVVMLAVARAGGVFVNVSPVLKSGQVRHILTDSGARRLVADPLLMARAELSPMKVVYLTGSELMALPCAGRVSLLDRESTPVTCNSATPTHREAIETDLATILYTSGSTGLPKGIMFSHRNLVAGAEIVATYLQNDEDDVVMAVLPFSFDYGLSQVTTMLRVGGTVVMQRSLMPGDILATLRTVKVTGLAMVPPLWPVILQNRRSLIDEPLSHLRYVTNSGGTVAPAHLDELRALLPNVSVYLMYGLTEAFRSTYLPPEAVDRGSSCIGQPIPGTDIFVLNEKGEEVGFGEIGELVHRGPTVAMGYWGDPVRTSAAYRPNPFLAPEIVSRENVVFSGDLVRRGEDGFLYFAGRRDAQMKTHGYRVSPEEVEVLLTSITGVREAVVFPEPDDTIGQRIIAVISFWAGESLTGDEVKAAVRAKAPHYLVPSRVHMIEAMPRGGTGKIDRERLRRTFEKQVQPQESTEQVSSTSS